MAAIQVIPTPNIQLRIDVPLERAPALRLLVAKSPHNAFRFIGVLNRPMKQEEVREVIKELNATYGLDLKVLNVQTLSSIASRDAGFVKSVVNGSPFWLTFGAGSVYDQLVKLRMDDGTVSALVRGDEAKLLEFSQATPLSEATVVVRAKYENLSHNYF